MFHLFGNLQFFSRLLSENNELLLDAADRRAALEDTLRRAEQQQVRVKNKSYLKKHCTVNILKVFRLYFFSLFFGTLICQRTEQMLGLFRMYFQHTVAAGKNNYPCSRYQRKRLWFFYYLSI